MLARRSTRSELSAAFRPFGKLRQSNIAAAKQLHRRALDSLYDYKLIAVGTFKVSPAPENEGEHWICEIHLIVAGATKEDLERAFSTRRDRGEVARRNEDDLNILMVQEVKTVGPVISEVLRRDLRGWQQRSAPKYFPHGQEKHSDGSFTGGCWAWPPMPA